MLVLSRKGGQKVVVGDNVVITVLAIRGDTVRLGFDAPAEIPVHREEVRQAIERESVTQPAGKAKRESPYFVECA
jgi:carbon storage regulator